MNPISLVCTVHEECGLARLAKLCDILDRIRPEVIFLEVPPESLDQLFDSCTSSNLESSAVRIYLENNDVELVPVDLPTPEVGFFWNYKYLQDSIVRTSSDFRRLRLWHSNYVRDYGFAYLNDELCSKMMSDIYIEMAATVMSMDDQRLTEAFVLWNRTNQLRETAMMERIHEYCCNNSFKQGAFLIGAAHRQGIIDKSVEMTGRYKNCVKWDFSGDACRTNGPSL